MAALVQPYPQHTTAITLLQSRPSSASGMVAGQSKAQSGQQYVGSGQSPRSAYNTGLPGVIGAQIGYRGSSVAPAQPYSFATSANFGSGGGQRQDRGAYRTTSTPSVPTLQTFDHSLSSRPRYHNRVATTNLSSGAGAGGEMRPIKGRARDDSSLPSIGPRGFASSVSPLPQSIGLAGMHGQPSFAQVAAGKVAPERYRRPSPRVSETTSSGAAEEAARQAHGSVMPSGSGMATVVHLYNHRAAGEKRISLPRNSATLRPHSHYGAMAGGSADDMLVQRQPTDEELKRFRRRSMHSLDAADYPKQITPQELKQQYLGMQARESARVILGAGPAAVSKKAAFPSHARKGSAESVASSSSNSKSSRSAARSSSAPSPATSPTSNSTSADEKSAIFADHQTQSQHRLVHIPPRISSTDGGKRLVNPSPSSKPVTMATGSSTGDGIPKPAAGPGAATATPTAAAHTNASLPASANCPVASSTPAKAPGPSQESIADSPAAKHLAAINGKGGRPKTKTSRLRRAFSFSSAAELRISEDADLKRQNDSSKLQKDPRPEDLYEEEQARIARNQEASGLGNSIYAGTKIFTGSNDNLSISSTASSASIMLRKMGRGVKKGSRSLVGLFRPKSMHGAPGPDSGVPEASQAEVSMITVEAERERVNVKSNADLAGDRSGTGFPRLERNSIDAIDGTLAGHHRPDRHGSTDSGSEPPYARKSILGGESERAEVLATIRKGILKTRNGSPSPATHEHTGKAASFNLPSAPHVESPGSTAPSTPEDGSAPKRNGSSVAIGQEDYFMSALRLRQDTKSAPGTPQGGVPVMKRNATFSPRIVFHDTWPGSEYDRRGEIATCNRLTPVLAQQIKEELNTFKMEMEVHETSKIYTHFF